MSAFSLSLGDTREIYDPEAVTKAMERAFDGPSQVLLQRTYQRMLDQGALRMVSKPSSSADLAPLVDACPNFSGVVEDLQRCVELALFGTSSLSLMPVLLLGEPGVGKTYFASQLAGALGVPHRFIPMSTMTSGWILSGSSPTWSGARPGKVAQALIDEAMANPVFLLDEVDKAGGDSRYDPYGALLQLLEKDTAKKFIDEFLDVPIDTSAVLWVGTANDASLIPDYILSRMRVYEVPSPTSDQTAAIGQRMYRGLLGENGWRFDPELPTSLLELLSEISPREMKKALLDAMGSARLEKRDALLSKDFKATNTKRKSVLGFGTRGQLD